MTGPAINRLSTGPNGSRYRRVKFPKRRHNLGAEEADGPHQVLVFQGAEVKLTEQGIEEPFLCRIPDLR